MRRQSVRAIVPFYKLIKLQSSTMLAVSEAVLKKGSFFAERGPKYFQDAFLAVSLHIQILYFRGFKEIAG